MGHTGTQVLCSGCLEINSWLEVEDLRLGRKEKKVLYSHFFFIKTLQRNYTESFPNLLCNKHGAETTKIKSIRKILSKGNNHLHHRTLASRRDLEEHQERSKDNNIGQHIRYSITVQ